MITLEKLTELRDEIDQLLDDDPVHEDIYQNMIVSIQKTKKEIEDTMDGHPDAPKMITLCLYMEYILMVQIGYVLELKYSKSS